MKKVKGIINYSLSIGFKEYKSYDVSIPQDIRVTNSKSFKIKVFKKVALIDDFEKIEKLDHLRYIIK